MFSKIHSKALESVNDKVTVVFVIKWPDFFNTLVSFACSRRILTIHWTTLEFEVLLPVWTMTGAPLYSVFDCFYLLFFYFSPGCRESLCSWITCYAIYPESVNSHVTSFISCHLLLLSTCQSSAHPSISFGLPVFCFLLFIQITISFNP